MDPLVNGININSGGASYAGACRRAPEVKASLDRTRNSQVNQTAPQPSNAITANAKNILNASATAIITSPNKNLN
jgi:hypothetical protein